MDSCPFCELLAQGLPNGRIEEAAAAFPDKYGVSKGHTLVVPVRHESDFLLLSIDEQAAIWNLARSVMAELKQAYQPDGFNIGINIGEAAGQTVGHAHLHVIPRYRGDATDPRGGVRWVIPERAVYW
jgi:diadenosine tetraphosphate (Ap4A) HIT family hydrolase